MNAELKQNNDKTKEDERQKVSAPTHFYTCLLTCLLASAVLSICLSMYCDNRINQHVTLYTPHRHRKLSGIQTFPC